MKNELVANGFRNIHTNFEAIWTKIDKTASKIVPKNKFSCHSCYVLHVRGHFLTTVTKTDFVTKNTK